MHDSGANGVIRQQKQEEERGGTLFLQAVSARAPVPPTQLMGICLGFDGKRSFLFIGIRRCSSAEESCPHSKFLLTEINSLGLLYGKLQHAYLFAISVKLRERALPFVYY